MRRNATNFPVFFSKNREIEARDTFEQMETQRVFAASNGEEDDGFNDLQRWQTASRSVVGDGDKWFLG